MSLLNKPRQEGEFPDWEQLYQTEAVQTLPWYFEGADHDLQQILTREQIVEGRFLDVGTGPGTQAVWLAGAGFEVTGSDLSKTAIAAAQAYALAQGVRVNFVQDDILASALEGPFDYIFDRGCFHVLPPESRSIYLATMQHLLSRNGRLFLKCFIVKEQGVRGPYRFSPQSIETLFAHHFQLLESWESHYEGNHPENPKALFTVFQHQAL